MYGSIKLLAEVLQSMKIKKAFLCLAIITFYTCVFAYNPPPSGENLYDFTSPSMVSGEISVAGGALFQVEPGHVTINPALPASEQRVVIDLSYAALIAPSKANTSGHAFNVGTIIPSKYGVFTGVVQGVFIPFDDMQLKNSVTIRGAYSKDILDSLYVGAGVSVAFGSNWALNLDMGFLYLPGKITWLPFMSDIRLAASLTGIGKPFNPSSIGIDGSATGATGFPSMFTPHFGFAGTFLEIKQVKAGLSLDLSFPTFQNLIFDTGLQFLFANMINVSTGWQFNLKETLEDVANYYPSVSVSVKFNFITKEESLLGRQGWEESEMIVSGAYKALNNSVHVASGGAALYLGLKDTAAPEITLWGNDEGNDE